MRSVKRRKKYLDGFEDINYTAKYRTRRKLASEQTPNQTQEDSNCYENEKSVENIAILSEAEVLHDITTVRDDVSNENEMINHDEDFAALQDCRNNPRNLEELLQSPGFCDPISTPVERSPAELLLMILKYSLSNHLPLTSTSNLIRLINRIFVTPVTPESQYMVEKFLNPNNNAEFHATCPNCTNYVGKFGAFNVIDKCTNCNAFIDVSKPSSGNYFAIVDPSEAIADYLHANEEYYNYTMQERLHERGHIKDVYDGKCYRNFVRNLPESAKQQYVTATFNTDGAPVFESSNYSIWPIFIMINELPVEHRFKNLIVCGLWFGKNKPHMNVFLDKFVETVNELSTVGIPCTIKGASLMVKLYALICCVDTVARPTMNGTMQFNAFYGCDWCFHPGEWINGSTRYPVLENLSKLRDVQNTVQLMKEAVEKGLPIFGVKNASPLINLHFFDIIKGFVPDYLHCFLAGIAKQLTEYLIELISAKDFKIIDLRLSKIKAPNQLGRLCRSLKDRALWKAREWENWLLYYSIPVLESIIQKKLLKHWSLIVNSLHILLKTDITYQQLNEADLMLHEFVSGMEEIYSKSAMSYNVHQLLHIAKSVYNWGPLWAHSTFPFEAGNHELLIAIKCPKGVNQQLLRYMNMQRSLNVLEEKIFTNSSSIVKQFCTDLCNPLTKKCLQMSEITYFGIADIIKNQLLDRFNLSSTTTTFMRMIKGGCLYASFEKINLRSCNSFAQLVDKRYIKIIKFLVDVDTDKQLTLCSIIQTTVCEFSKSLQRIISIDDEVTAVKTTDIDKSNSYEKTILGSIGEQFIKCTSSKG